MAIIFLSNIAIAQNKPTPPKLEPKVKPIAGLNAKFILALISDGEGGAWIGTEDDGVFHYNNLDGNVMQFTTKKWSRR
ncbi:MAG: hypothetical protein LBC74_12775 [Planctomycetaceae bacterium]|nr:hypothetical protein [Planctomycetaceae bacterium]